LRVLVVDDNEVNRRVVLEPISSWGMRNASCASAAEALEAIRTAQAERDPYHFVISDYQMPEIDGVTLASMVRSDQAIRDVVFVMLTSVSNWRELSPEKNVGIDACLVKPVRHSRLMDTLVTAWSKKAPPPASSNVSYEKRTLTDIGALARHVAEDPSVAALRVLVVEDNPVNQKVALMMLARLGVRADIAGNGREAVELLNAKPYDLVFMDCQMPEMSGYEATSEIRRVDGPNRHVRIVAMTADAFAGSRERCLEAGMDDFITKPVKLDELARALQSVREPRPASPSAV